MRTGEVGIVKILDFMRHRGGIRLIMKAGSKALSDYREKYKSVYDISNLLSAKQPEIFNAVERVYSEIDDVNRSFFNFKKLVAENDKNNLVFCGNISYFISSYYDSDMMRSLVNYGMEKSALSIAFSGDDENGYSYIAGSNSLDMKAVAKSLNSSLNGRGGGRDTMIQGKVSANINDIKTYVENSQWR
jgi:alanyl-tRNA synthetase